MSGERRRGTHPQFASAGRYFAIGGEEESSPARAADGLRQAAGGGGKQRGDGSGEMNRSKDANIRQTVIKVPVVNPSVTDFVKWCLRQTHLSAVCQSPRAAQLFT